MRLSVVVTTYNQPEWLEKVLWGYGAQTHQDFEVVIADDGSGDATRQVIDAARAYLPAVQHVWHEDVGFRKTQILNRAIVAAATDYLVFTDGDCVPRRDFLAVHAAFARPGRFLSGGYIKLPMDVSKAITREDVEQGRATDYAWLRKHGAGGRQLRRLGVPAWLAPALDRITPTRPSFNGHNASVWKRDAIAANGFDERMGWGGLDREFGERLENAGVKGFQIRHRALCVHLDHPRGYKKPEIIAKNRAIRDEVARTKATRTPAGIDGHAASA